MVTKMGGRVKREDCKSTRHDHLFSKWQILIGPSDWKDYSLGKCGVERYRTQNLPTSCACPGLYELGMAKAHIDIGRELDPRCIIVVYLGQAENVRTRLQHYGRAGSHLDHGNSICLSDEKKGSSLERGPALFQEVFSRGFPIVFRWVPMKSKKEAENVEAELLRFFDYAWNKGGNGSRRRDDILRKLDKIASASSHFNLLRKLPHLHAHIFSGKRRGIKIEESIPWKETETNNQNNGWQILKFGKNRPRVIRENNVGNDNFAICGVSLANGTVCTSKPVEGRKRCADHKGKRINGSISKSVTCREELAVAARPLAPVNDSEDYNICGASLADGSVCRSKPVVGRKRCSRHKGKRVSVITRQEEMAVERSGDSLLIGGLCYEGNPVCGVFFVDGSVCNSCPVKGRKRCEEHKGMRIRTIPGII